METTPFFTSYNAIEANFDVMFGDDPDRIVKMWTRGVPVEDGARRQLLDLVKMPFIFRHVAAMPDVHQGIGATIGSVIATEGAVIPSAVGVDIGCGMIAARTTLREEDLMTLNSLRHCIESAVPHGRTNNGQQGDRGAWHNIPADVKGTWDSVLGMGHALLVGRTPKLKGANSVNHLGTLGTGNHFIEVCLDTEGFVWVMIHSGSRGIGAAIGNYFMKAAQEYCAQHFIQLPNRDLAYLVEGTSLFDEYMDAVVWAQRFAWSNRCLMMNRVLDILEPLSDTFQSEVIAHCHHNFVEKERHFGKDVWVTRKGAVRARTGDMVIIPGSMGARSYIAEGLGNRESFTSCSHGAGRKMSRSQAFKTFTVADHEAATEGVECRKDKDVIDETPGCYKNIDDVIEAERDLVAPKHILKQIVCVKG